MMNAILTCSELRKCYGNKEVLSEVGLTLERGRIVGLLGPNGSGKTTLIKLACGLLTPTSGSIEIAGMQPSCATKAIVSYLPERNCISEWMTVNQVIHFYADFYEDFNTVKAYNMIGDLGIDATQRIKTMSKGTKEKVQLILVMSREAELYLLDEPIGGVDPAAREYILQTIIANYNEDATVVISTHLIADVENILDEVIFLQDGCIKLHKSVDDIREETKQSVDDLFREVFRC